MALPKTSPSGSEAPDLDKLRRLVTRLRAPDGCPWDRAQTLADVRAYVIEEAHEVAAAIDAEDPRELAGELGDLLFQVVFVAVLAEEDGAFSLASVVDAIHAKMVARHPHVFGDSETLADAAEVSRAWERRKLAEGDGDASLLAGVPTSLPALVAAYRMTQKAAGVGFDWPEVSGVLAKVREELAEVEAELATPEREGSVARAREEVGDLLFAAANLARHLGVDPEAALAATNAKFRRRFGAIEDALRKHGRTVVEADLAEMDALWDAAKRREA